MGLHIQLQTLLVPRERVTVTLCKTKILVESSGTIETQHCNTHHHRTARLELQCVEAEKFRHIAAAVCNATDQSEHSIMSRDTVLTNQSTLQLLSATLLSMRRNHYIVESRTTVLIIELRIGDKEGFRRPHIIG